MSKKKRSRRKNSKTCNKKQVKFFIMNWVIRKSKEAADDLVKDLIKEIIKAVICLIVYFLYRLLN